MDGRKLRAKRCALRDGSRLRSTKRFQFVFDVAVTLAGGIPSRLPFESSHLIWSFFMTMRKLGVKRKRSTPAMTPSCCSSSFLVNSYSNIIINNFSSKHYRPLLEISSSSTLTRSIIIFPCIPHIPSIVPFFAYTHPSCLRCISSRLASSHFFSRIS